MYGLIGKMVAAPGKRGELTGILLGAIANMPGCLSYVVADDASDADAIWITEVWDTKGDHDASLALPAVRDAIARARPMIAGSGDRIVTTPRGGHGLPANRRGSSASTVVVRLSRGSFNAAIAGEVERRLDASQHTLIPAIRALRGCLHFWAGIDRASGTMINASVWESIDAARQIDTLAPMLAFAGEFIALGVAFERPIVNYTTLWQL